MFKCEPGKRSRHSDSLRDIQSGDLIPVEARFTETAQTVCGARVESCETGTYLFSGVGAMRCHSLSSTAEVRRSVELCLSCPSVLSWTDTA